MMRLRLFGVLLAALLGSAAQALTWKITLLEQADNPELDRTRLERAYLGHPGGPPSEGVALALDEAEFELKAAKVDVRLDIVPVAGSEEARAAASRADKTGTKILLSNLPAEWMTTAADAVKLPVINLSASADRLRERDCRLNVFHVPPSERMRADAIAQALINRKWSQVLLLSGTSGRDTERSAAAQAAIQRYGLKLVASKTFKLSSDPRERQLANPLLLTGGASYDVVWVVDSDGEFARTLPYNTAAARPVVGDAGWVALAWHAQFERFGAPQVSRRFAKSARRAMTDHDWASWMAGKAIAAAAAAQPQANTDQLLQVLGSINLDGSKGVTLQFRPWDRQLRQPLVLTDGQGVLALLPLEGILHPRNTLDTLGADEPQKLCKTRP
jgi:ABC transporter substrate binding protein (PQQ-dependent alcohol dehydrogenase system)